MTKVVEDKLKKIPVIKQGVQFLKKVKLPGFNGLSVYDLFEMYVIGVVEGALTSRAGSIAFSLFMALFPMLIFLITLLPFVIPYVPVTDFDVKFMAFMESFIPDGADDYFLLIFEQIKSQKRSGLLSSAFGASIILVANGVNAIFSGFENSFHVHLTRSFFKQYLYALLIGLGLSLLFIGAAVLFIYIEFHSNQYLSDSALANQSIFLSNSFKVLFFVFLIYIVVSTLYFYGTKQAKSAKFFSIGAIMTTALVVLTSYLFGIYIDKFSTYNELYGAIGGLLILMVYIYLNSNILLLGFELNASLNRLKQGENV